MQAKITAGSNWSTSSFGDSADTSPMELSGLSEHLSACQGSVGRLFAVRCGAQALHGFVAARFVTTLVLALALLGSASLLIW